MMENRAVVENGLFNAPSASLERPVAGETELAVGRRGESIVGSGGGGGGKPVSGVLHKLRIDGRTCSDLGDVVM